MTPATNVNSSGLGFPTVYVVVFYMFNCLRYQVAIRLVDIAGIVDYQYVKINSQY